ncbi:hypothetical protein DUI87_04800 [Hirundo rustica rustica]|uniref:Uncharacterized protein n=1 Tax=Hirundo rustica rustica TaxID=333673 RepID=A0A3M0L0H3_HIRRU|nr:hypothetical protein DUI87_04800 [Hirundo rustica rustica]
MAVKGECRPGTGKSRDCSRASLQTGFIGGVGCSPALQRARLAPLGCSGGFAAVRVNPVPESRDDSTGTRHGPTPVAVWSSWGSALWAVKRFELLCVPLMGIVVINPLNGYCRGRGRSVMDAEPAGDPTEYGIGDPIEYGIGDPIEYGIIPAHKFWAPNSLGLESGKVPVTHAMENVIFNKTRSLPYNPDRTQPFRGR